MFKPTFVQSTAKNELNEEKTIVTKEFKTTVANKQDKKEKNSKDMTTNEKIALLNNVIDNTSKPKARRVKKDRGLIERTESSTIILTEDNKELLHD